MSRSKGYILSKHPLSFDQKIYKESEVLLGSWVTLGYVDPWQ